MIPLIKVLDLEQKEIKKILSRGGLKNRKEQKQVAEIVEEVQKYGDQALVKYTEKFDGVKLKTAFLRVKKEEIKAAYQKSSKEFLKSLGLAKRRIFSYHRKQKPKSLSFQKEGVFLGEKFTPLRRVGVYVPGGKAAYPSTVLMTVIPARVAGVEEIALVTPPSPPNGGVNPYTLVAASELGVSEIYKVGGAQAIAALAYGTKTIKKVDKIIGPGNIYVTLAKKLVLGEVGIDLLAGPSEVLILADSTARASYIAADMLAQAEHDPLASSFLVTTSLNLAKVVNKELAQKLPLLKNKKVAREALKKRGRILVASSLEKALKLVNLIAPEHLELIVKNPRALVKKVESAGAIFLGAYTPVTVGDYLAGPNHILPTGGTARFSSPLGVADFLKKSSLISYSKEALKKAQDTVSILAEAEGLEAHAQSVKIRLQKTVKSGR